MNKPYLLIIIAITAVLLSSAADADRQKVLVINSYHAHFPWVVRHNEALRTDLAKDTDLVFFYMDTKRLPHEEYENQARLAMDTFEAEKPEIVILADDNALRLLGKKISSRGIPVVYLGINTNPRDYIEDMTMITGVLERPLLKRSIAYLKDIMGDKLKRCLILFDDGTTSRCTYNYVFKGKKSLSFYKTRTDIELVSLYSRWKEAVLSAKDNGYDALILGLYHTIKDDNGQHTPDETIAHWTAQHSPIPIFAFWDYAVGKDKAIGGLVLAAETQGQAAATLVRRILAGEHPSSTQPITPEGGRFIFSRSGLKRWDIKLPAYFNDPTERIDFVQ